MEWVRREFLKLAGAATLVAPAMLARGARSAIAQIPAAAAGTVFDVRSFGATGDGKAGVTLSPVHMPEDYQCQRLLDIIVAVHPLRDQLADHVERGRHHGDSLGIVAAVKLNQMQHHTSPFLESP